MPLYEYECEPCGHRFEQIRRFSDPPLTVCPNCGGAVRKLQSSPAIQFKGTGWYVTDYAKKGAQGAASESSESSKSGDGAGAKADGKPDKPGTKTGASTSASDSSQATSKKPTKGST